MNTKNFGYVRVSTADQNAERELSKMRELGIGERDILLISREVKSSITNHTILAAY